MLFHKIPYYRCLGVCGAGSRDFGFRGFVQSAPTERMQEIHASARTAAGLGFWVSRIQDFRA